MCLLFSIHSSINAPSPLSAFYRKASQRFLVFMETRKAQIVHQTGRGGRREKNKGQMQDRKCDETKREKNPNPQPDLLTLTLAPLLTLLLVGLLTLLRTLLLTPIQPLFISHAVTLPLSLPLPMSLTTPPPMIWVTRIKTGRIVVDHPTRIPPRKDHVSQAQVRTPMYPRHDKGDADGGLRAGALVHPVQAPRDMAVKDAGFAQGHGPAGGFMLGGRRRGSWAEVRACA